MAEKIKHMVPLRQVVESDREPGWRATWREQIKKNVQKP